MDLAYKLTSYLASVCNYSTLPTCFSLYAYIFRIRKVIEHAVCSYVEDSLYQFITFIYCFNLQNFFKLQNLCGGHTKIYGFMVSFNRRRGEASWLYFLCCSLASRFRRFNMFGTFILTECHGKAALLSII